MHTDGGDGIDTVGVGDTIDSLGDGGVLGAGLDGGGGNKHGVVGGYGNIAHFVINLGGRAGSLGNDEGVCGYGDVSVNVASEIELDNVSCFEGFLCILVMDGGGCMVM